MKTRLLLLCLALAAGSVSAKSRMLLGANVNEHGAALDLDLLKQSRTEVVRTFFPATRFITGQRDLETDEDLLAVKRAGQSGQKVILCLKWNFAKAKWRVPEPGSEREQKCFEWADALIDELSEYTIALETVNEVSVDTSPEDMLPGDDGTIPMVCFLQRLVDHLDDQNHKGANGKTLPLYSGGFTRLDLPRVRENPGVQALLDWIEEDDRLTGANFHIHMAKFAGFEKYLRYIRTRIPRKPYIITEFSMIWKYRDNLNAPVGSTADGQEFLIRYGYDADMTVMGYINAAIEHPVSEEEWNAFLKSQDWYDPAFLGNACRVMEQYGTKIATFAFQQKSSGGQKLSDDSTPWILNPVFATQCARRDDHRAAVSARFMTDYLEWQKFSED